MGLVRRVPGRSLCRHLQDLSRSSSQDHDGQDWAARDVQHAHACKDVPPPSISGASESCRGSCASARPRPPECPLQQQKAAARQASVKVSLDNSLGVLWPKSSPKHDEVVRHIMKMICTDFEPFTIVNHPGFFELIAHLQPRFQMPCRSTIRRKITPIFDEYRREVQQEVDGATFVATTSDIWTDGTSNYTFISLTGRLYYILVLHIGPLVPYILVPGMVPGLVPGMVPGMVPYPSHQLAIASTYKIPLLSQLTF